MIKKRTRPQPRIRDLSPEVSEQDELEQGGEEEFQYVVLDDILRPPGDIL